MVIECVPTDTLLGRLGSINQSCLTSLEALDCPNYINHEKFIRGAIEIRIRIDLNSRVGTIDMKRAVPRCDKAEQ